MKITYPHKTRNDFLKGIVSQLVARRKELGLTQDDVNDLLGVADRLVSKWECGSRTPTSFNLHCWAEALKSDLGLLHHANDNEPPKK
ncbi:helix-turn-helix domain-containing protein [Kordia sp. TARA_039_SRF]|nr:helix-turn-helix domain-containing protein [Kordia sp. TARA_039_SRF]